MTSAPEIANPAGLVSEGVEDGGIGKSGIADFKGADSGRSLDVPEFFRRGISPNFQSCEPVALEDLEFLRRDRSDIFRPNASVASFAIALIDAFRSILADDDLRSMGTGDDFPPTLAPDDLLPTVTGGNAS